MNLSAKYFHCQNCGRPIRYCDRVEKCAYSLEQMCSRCSVSDRFSSAIADQIPLEYHEKFRVYTELMWIVLTALLIALVGSTWVTFVGWDSTNIFGMVSGIILVFVKWIIGLLLFLVILKLPRLGTWMFYWWIEKPMNRERMEEDVKRYKTGEYQTQDVWYYRKLRLLYILKKMKLKPLYIVAIVGNLAMIYWFFAGRMQLIPPGTEFSAFVGLFFVGAHIINVLTLWAGAAFYCKKDSENRKRGLIELLSWGYMCLLLGSVVMFAWGQFVHYGVFSAIDPSKGLPSIELSGFLFVLSAGLIVGLGIVLFLATPDFEWRKNDQKTSKWSEKPKGSEADDAWKSSEASETSETSEAPTGFSHFLRRIWIKVFKIAFVFILVLSSILVMVDFSFIISILSYHLVIVYGFVIFVLLKLVPKNLGFARVRKQLNYRALVRLSAVIMVVNFLPVAGTVIYTNPTLETQFTNAFGPTWETDIQADPTYSYMHNVPLSMYDAYFAYEMPVNAEYDRVYMQSHPRYVQNGQNGEILSDGSAVFNGITHELKFDAYLPARSEFNGINFGDQRAEKFPVLIFLHGAGVDRGVLNANYTTQYFANLGYAAFDVSYGYMGYVNYPFVSGKELGYDFVDTVLQIATFTKYLEAHADYYHADLSNTYVIGRSLGGWMSLCVGYLANSSYAGGNYSSQMNVRGVIPIYPASDFPGFGSQFFGMLDDLMDSIGGEVGLRIRGSSDPADATYNPDWFWYNPLWLAANAEPGSLPFTFGLQGNQDSNIPPGATRRLETALKNNEQKVIAAYYPFLSHVFDVVHWSPQGQSVIYYLERFLALTSVN